MNAEKGTVSAKAQSSEMQRSLVCGLSVFEREGKVGDEAEE